MFVKKKRERERDRGNKKHMMKRNIFPRFSLTFVYNVITHTIGRWVAVLLRSYRVGESQCVCTKKNQCFLNRTIQRF